MIMPLRAEDEMIAAIRQPVSENVFNDFSWAYDSAYSDKFKQRRSSEANLEEKRGWRPPSGCLGTTPQYHQTEFTLSYVDTCPILLHVARHVIPMVPLIVTSSIARSLVLGAL